MNDVAVMHKDNDGIADIVRDGLEYYVIERNAFGRWHVCCYSAVAPDDVLHIDVLTGNRFCGEESCCYDNKRTCSKELFRYVVGSEVHTTKVACFLWLHLGARWGLDVESRPYRRSTNRSTSL